MSGDRPRRNIYRVAFSHRDFRWLMAAAVQSRGGDFVYSVALIVVIFSRTDSAAWVSLTAVLARVPLVVLPPIAGALADRFPRRDLMIVLDIARGTNMVAIAILIAAHGPVIAIVALAVLSGALATPYGPANVALLPNLMPEKDLAAANAVYGALESLAMVIGPAVGGALLVLGSPTIAFLVNAGTFALSALCLTRIERDPKPVRTNDDEDGIHGLAGLRALTADPGVALIAIGLVAACVTVGATAVLYVVASEEMLGLGANGYGYLLAASGAGGVIGSLLGDRMAASSRLALVVGNALLIVAIGTAALGWLHAPPIAYACTVAYGAGYLLLEVLAVTLMQRYIDASVLGQASGTLDAAAFGAVLVGSGIVGPVEGALGFKAAVLVATAPALVAGVITLVAARRLDARSTAGRDALAPRVQLLSRVEPLLGSGRPALERLAAESIPERAAAGTVVVRQGEPATDFFVIVEGTLDVSSSGEGTGQPEFIRTLGPGDYFGEIGLLENRPRTATVRATADAELLRVGGETFREVVTELPGLTGPFREIVATRLARSHGSGTGE